MKAKQETINLNLPIKNEEIEILIERVDLKTGAKGLERWLSH